MGALMRRLNVRERERERERERNKVITEGKAQERNEIKRATHENA